MNTPSRKNLPRLFFFLAAVLILVKVIRDQNKEIVLNEIAGQTMGTIPYHIKYKTKGERDYKPSIDSLLVAFNQSLSTYLPASEISRFNRADTLVFESSLFYPVLSKSRHVYEATGGAFDPTIGPLVNAWGFGPEKDVHFLSQEQIDSLLLLVDFSKITFSQSHAIKPSGMYLDFSAIAKGYAIDLVGNFLRKQGVQDFMVEIGGEVIASGVNEKGSVWNIGIEDPLVKREEQKLFAIVRLENRAVATSGNYRNYFERDGRIYAHIIDPRTGYTSEQSILSASVFAADCMTADAYATAFMVLGVEEAMKIVEQDAGLEAMFIYRGAEKEEVAISSGMKNNITLLEGN